jgi:3-isopropylmalate dehydratase small subunit
VELGLLEPSPADHMAGAGVQAVIAKSFAFIYGRNQPSLGLLGITMSDDAFFEAATEGKNISINVPTRTIVVGDGKVFKFKMAEMEYRLTVNKGISESYKMYGKAIWEKLTESDMKVKVGDDTDGRVMDKRMEW